MVERTRRIQAKALQSHKTTATSNKDKNKNKKPSSQSDAECVPQLALEHKLQRRYYGYCPEAEPERTHAGWTYQRLKQQKNTKQKTPYKQSKGFLHYTDNPNKQKLNFI